MVAYSLHAHNFDFKLHKVKEKMLSDRTDRATVKSLIMSVYMFWAKTNKINQKKNVKVALWPEKSQNVLFLKGFKSMYYALIHPFSYFLTNVRMM